MKNNTHLSLFVWATGFVILGFAFGIPILWLLAFIGFIGTAICYNYYTIHQRRYSSWIELIDRVISSGIYTQIWAFIALMAAILFVFIVIVFVFDIHLYSDDTFGLWEKIRGVVLLFLDPGFFSVENSTGIQIFAMLISFIGMVLLGGVFISTVSNIVERRVDSLRNGLVVYDHFDEHYVIIGYSEIAVILILDIFKHYGWDCGVVVNKEMKIDGKLLDKLPKVLILTNQDVHVVRAQIWAHLPKKIEERVVLYAGNIDSYEHIHNLNIQRAKEVYVLGEQNEYGRDTKNLECVHLISEIRGCGREPLQVNVQFDRISSYSIIQRLNLPKEYIQDKNGNPNIYFRPFNFFENWGRILWGFYEFKRKRYDSLDFEPLVNDKYVHLVIVGFNRMGRALLLEALRVCHYPNFMEADEEAGVIAQNKTRITIVDKSMDELLPLFKAQYPYLSQIEDIDIEFLNNKVEDELVCERLKEAAMEERALLTVAICLRDPDLSLAVGLSLPEAVYYSVEERKDEQGNVIVNDMGKVEYRIKSGNSRVLIRQELRSGIGGILDKEDGKYIHVRTFGQCMEGVSDELLDDTMAMYVNAYFSVKYCDFDGLCCKKEKDALDSILLDYWSRVLSSTLEGKPNPKDFVGWLFVDREFMDNIAFRLWIYQPEHFRFSNRYQVDMYGTYLKYLSPELKDMYPLQALAQMEHLRWCAERSIVGYKSATDVNLKDDNYRLHRLIMPFNKLGIDRRFEKEKEKDEDVIGNLEKLIKLLAPADYVGRNLFAG